MDELCSACLCIGRNLYALKDTGSYDLYTQILNEIPSFVSGSCPRVCWECCALLRRLATFKARVQLSYTQLFMFLGQAEKKTKEVLIRTPHLQTHHVLSISYPEVSIKADPEDCVALPLEELKVEESAYEERRRGSPRKNKRISKKNTKEHLIRTPDLQTHHLLSISDPEVSIKSETEDCVALPLEEVEVEESAYEERSQRNSPRKNKRISKKTKDKKKSKQKTKPKKKKEVQKKSNTKKRQELAASKESADLNVDDSDDDAFVGDDVYDERKSEELPMEEERLEQSEDLARDGGVEDVAVEKGNSKLKAEKANGVVKDKLPELVGDRPKCPECGKMFSSMKTYRYHLNTLHKGQNRYPCPRCGKVYQWKSNLGRHMRTHKARDSGELYCGACDKRFASVATYRQHLRASRRHVAENEFRYSCAECGKRFPNKTRLRDHVDWDHLHKVKFTCALCHKPFKCHTSLYVHMQNVHRNNKKENLCHICGKSYQNGAKLKYHIIAMHTSETPYRCGACHAAFGWYSSLYRHTREVHHKMKLQPKKMRKPKRSAEPVPPMMAPDMMPHMHQPGPAV